MMLDVDNTDFLPDRIRAARARRHRIAREACLLAICIVSLLAVAYARQGRIQQARAEVAFLNRRAADVRRQLATRQSLERQQADLMVMGLITNDLGSRVNTLDILTELENVVPGSIALQRLDLETIEERVPVRTTHRRRTAQLALGQPQQKERLVKRVRLTITGLSPTDIDVATFIGQLSASPLFEDVNMGYVRDEEFNGRRARQFQASCHIVR